MYNQSAAMRMLRITTLRELIVARALLEQLGELMPESEERAFRESTPPVCSALVSKLSSAFIVTWFLFARKQE